MSLEFKKVVNPRELHEVASRIETYKQVFDVDEEYHSLLHSRAVRALDAKMKTTEALKKEMQRHYLNTPAIGEAHNERMMRILGNQLEGTNLVEADYQDMTVAEVLEILPASNKVLFKAATESYYIEFGVSELKKLIKGYAQELEDMQYTVEHINAFLVTAKKEGVAAWYTAQGILIETLDFDSSMDGSIQGNAGVSLLEAA